MRTLTDLTGFCLFIPEGVENGFHVVADRLNKAKVIHGAHEEITFILNKLKILSMSYSQSAVITR